MTNQRRINSSQGTINDSQGTINAEQGVINDRTKIDLSISSFWSIIIIIAGFILTGAGIYYAFNLKIEKVISGQDLTQYKIEQLSKKLDSYVTDRQAAADKMQGNTDYRNKQISWIQQGLVRCCPQYSPLN